MRGLQAQQQQQQQQQPQQQQPPAVLNATAVRERAKSVPGCKEVLAQGQTVLSFLVGLDSSSNCSGVTNKNSNSSSSIDHDHRLARVNIWTNTGTVGTSRVVDGKVRQSFRRNVQSLDAIERLLQHPEGPVEINESLIGITDDDDDEDVKRRRPPSSSSSSATASLTTTINLDAVLSSPRMVQKELELADVGLCILQGEKEKLEKHVQHLDAILEVGASTNNNIKLTKLNTSRGQNNTNKNSNMQSPQSAYTTSDNDTDDNDTYADENDDDNDDDDYDDDDDDHDNGRYYDIPASSSSSLHGTEFHFKLPTDVMKQVDQCLQDIARMNKTVKGVATNGKGTVFLYGNGGVAYTPSIPKALYHKLRQLRSSSYSSRPRAVALGTRDRYYVSFNDGTADWKGPGALDKILKKALIQAKLPRCVAFGSTYDSFFVVFHDGSWQYQGRGIPETLEEKLASRDDRADLVTVNLGPNGEWFLKAENGRMWWSGISDHLDVQIQTVLNGGGYLHSVDFGENSSYFLSYDES